MFAHGVEFYCPKCHKRVEPSMSQEPCQNCGYGSDPCDDCDDPGFCMTGGACPIAEILDRINRDL